MISGPLYKITCVTYRDRPAGSLKYRVDPDPHRGKNAVFLLIPFGGNELLNGRYITEGLCVLNAFLVITSGSFIEPS